MLHRLWPTNIWVEPNFLSDEKLKAFHQTVLPHIEKYNGVPEIFNKDITIPNLFLESDEPIQHFRQLVKTRLYEFLEIEGFINPEELDIEINVFPRKFVYGDRARPHTHRGIDYVGVFYVDLDVVDSDENTCDRDDGRLLLIDPIAQRSRGLNHQMLFQLKPIPNLFIIHPAYMFHESEMYKGNKDLILIVINARIKDRQQSNSFIKL
jgi:hypothetical protein